MGLDIPIVSYYPKYQYLDSMLEKSGNTDINLYLDFKNVAQGLYYKDTVLSFISESRRCRHIDLRLFFSFLEFVSWHKDYARKRNVKLNMYFFWERGDSAYHTAIHKEYKEARHLADFFGLELSEEDLFRKILNKNYDLILKVGNQLPGVTAIQLDYLEADFIPYYLIKLNNADHKTHIIYSNDKDMYQCLEEDNTFQFVRHYRKLKILSKNNVMSEFLKGETTIGPDYFPLLLSIIGDDGDGFKMVNGIAEKTLLKVVDELPKLFGTMDEVYKNIKDKKSIIREDYRTKNKVLQRIIKDEELIIRNLKLASFRLICDFFDNDYHITTIDKRKKLLEDLSATRKNITNGIVLLKAFEDIGISVPLEEHVIISIFR